MKYALALNGFIIFAIVSVAWGLSQPYALFGLLLLKEMPWGLRIDEIKANRGEATSQDVEAEAGYQDHGMGFMAHDTDTEGGDRD